MAYAPIQLISVPLEDYAGYWLKFYEQGTLTPLAMATDVNGGTTLAKAEISSGGTVPIGFIKTAGDALLNPFVDGDYDAWLFPTSAEADADDTTSAIQIADNLNADVISAYWQTSKTLAAALVLTASDAGRKIFVTSADGGEFTVRYNATPSTYADDGATYCGTQFIPSGGDGTIGIVRDYEKNINVKWFGAVGDGSTDDTASIQKILDLLDGTGNGGIIYFPGSVTTYIVTSTLLYQQTGLTDINPGIAIIGDGRRTSIIEYTGTSGFCLQIKGATGAAVSSTGRLGLVEGVTLKSIGFKGTGVLSGNTDSGVYIQGVEHFLMEDVLINDFPNRGLWTDRIYYNLSPDATLDDRGAFITLRHSEISEIGLIALLCGGLSAATDYSADHLYTENLHITANDAIGAKIYAQNWTDNGSLFYGDSIGLHLYAQNSNILTQNVTMIGSRFEGGQSDCMLKLDSCLTGQFINCFFPGHAGPLPITQIKIGSDASYNIGYVTFENCIHQTATTAFDIVGNGGVTGVKIINPRFNTITNEVVNSNSKPVQMIKAGVYEFISGGSSPIALEGASGDVLTSKLAGDTYDWLSLNNSSKLLGLGNGTAAIDAFLKRLSITAGSAAGMSSGVPFSVQNTQAFIYSGTATPEAAVTAAVGSIFLRTDGGANTTLYVKESGAGNTGWAAM